MILILMIESLSDLRVIFRQKNTSQIALPNRT
jgi:hypothetical protein